MKLTEASVLVVDDEPALREIFGKWLRALGCPKVSVAANGAEALELLGTDHFDLLVTDVRMPVVDGVTLVRRLREVGTSIPSVIFVSGFGDVDAKEMYALGVEAFLPKPIRMEELMAVMEKALAERCDLWLKPMVPSPRQTMEVVGKDRGTAEERAVHLGRGGFCAPYAGPLSVGKVAFSCEVEAMMGEVLKGEGYVRWRSSVEAMVGVEFFYMDSGCRARLLEEMARHPPQCFIPSA